MLLLWGRLMSTQQSGFIEFAALPMCLDQEHRKEQNNRLVPLPLHHDQKVEQPSLLRAFHQGQDLAQDAISQYPCELQQQLAHTA